MHCALVFSLLKFAPMNTSTAIKLAGSSKGLAELLGIHPSAVSQWGDSIPEARIWQLRVLRPSWFESKAQHVELIQVSAPAQ